MDARLTATDITREALHALACRAWPVPAALQKRLFKAFQGAPCFRACTLRHQLSLLGHCDLDAMFQHTATPRFIVDLIDDFVSTGIFTRQEGSAIQEAVLSGVTANGTWYSCQNVRERNLTCSQPNR